MLDFNCFLSFILYLCLDSKDAAKATHFELEDNQPDAETSSESVK